MLVSQSFGKNLGLYGDRIGFLSFVLSDASCVRAVRGQVTLVLRPMYGNPCRAPAVIIERVLGDPVRRDQWRLHLSSMLEARAPHRDWSDITRQTGMFWYSGLTRDQGELLASHHVYITPTSGRICLCG